MSIVMNTHLGALETGLNVNRDMRWTLFVGLSTSSSYYEGPVLLTVSPSMQNFIQLFGELLE